MFQNTRVRGPMEIHGDPPEPRREKQSWPVGLHPCHLAGIHVYKYSCVWERLEQDETIRESEGRARLERSRKLAQENTALAMREWEDLGRMGEL